MCRLTAAAILSSAFLVATIALPLAQQQPAPSQQPPKQEGSAPPQASQQPRQGTGNGSTTSAKPIVPVAASTIAANPDPYVGEYISLTAAVEQALTKSTFSVDQNKAKADKEILIIAPTLTGTVDPKTYVTVLGELVKFDPEEVKKKTKNYSLDLSPELVAKYKGKPAVIATAVVVNSTGIDIAKVLPPPMTAEEEAFQKVMRQVGPANTALRGAIDKMDAAAVKDQAAILAKAFTQTEAFWKTRGKADAVGFAVEAKKHADAITSAASAAKWDDIKASATPLGQQCASCHGAYRERLDDGSFRIKAGSR
jgi:cytochrome c556